MPSAAALGISYSWYLRCAEGDDMLFLSGEGVVMTILVKAVKLRITYYLRNSISWGTSV